MSFSMVSPSDIVFVAHCCLISFARFMMSSFLVARTSSMALSLNLQSNGPTLSMLSIAAAISEQVSMSVLIGISASPFVVFVVLVDVTSILPTLETRWSSFRFISGPRSPSVCPKIAPIMSALSTSPSTSKDSLT